MLLFNLPFQAPSLMPEPRQGDKLLPGGTSMVVVCDRQDILSLVLISSVVLFPQTLNLELSTCATHGLALVRARQPQLLVCIEPLVGGDMLTLIPQAKRLPAAPKVLLICDSHNSQLLTVPVAACCDGVLGADSADAGTVFQALRVVLGGDTYRDHGATTAPQGFNGFNRPQGGLQAHDARAAGAATDRAWALPTRKSASSCTWGPARSKPTCPACWRSWVSVTAPRPRFGPLP